MLPISFYNIQMIGTAPNFVTSSYQNKIINIKNKLKIYSLARQYAGWLRWG